MSLGDCNILGNCYIGNDFPCRAMQGEARKPFTANEW